MNLLGATQFEIFVPTPQKSLENMNINLLFKQLHSLEVANIEWTTIGNPPQQYLLGWKPDSTMLTALGTLASKLPQFALVL